MTNSTPDPSALAPDPGVTLERDWDVLLSQIGAASLLVNHGDYLGALGELDKARKQATDLKAALARRASLPTVPLLTAEDVADLISAVASYDQFSDERDRELEAKVKAVIASQRAHEPCPRCKGTGRVDRSSFRDPQQTITSRCDVCKGMGAL